MKPLKKCVIGLNPLVFDPSGAYRLRAFYHLERLLVDAGYETYSVDINGAMHCDVVIIGAYCSKDVIRVQRDNLILQKQGVAVVFDFADDLRPFAEKEGILQPFNESFTSLVNSVNVATVSSLGLEQRFKSFTSRPLIQVDDLSDRAFSGKVIPPKKHGKGKPLTIGWHGCTHNFETLISIQDQLSACIARAGVDTRVCVLTPFRPPADEKVKFEYQWKRWNFASDKTNDLAVSQFDIGLVPVFPGVAKASQRVVSLALSGALPIASDTLDNRFAMEEAAPELLCKTPSDWERMLEKAINDPEWRISKTLALQESIRRRFNRESILSRWIKVLELALESKGTFSPRPIAKAKTVKVAYEGADVFMHKAFLKERWRRLAGKFDTACIYGAGKYTSWLLKNIRGVKGPKILAILDDKATGNSKFSRFNLLPAKGISSLKPSCVILGTDTFQKEMSASLARQGLDSCEIVDIYEDMPKGPYPKSSLRYH